MLSQMPRFLVLVNVVSQDPIQFMLCEGGHLLKAACESFPGAGVKVQSVCGMPFPCYLGISCGWPNPS